MQLSRPLTRKYLWRPDPPKSMHLGRSEPLGPHKPAVRYFLNVRGEKQIFNQLRFALWWIALHRLQFRQLLLGEAPEFQERALLSKLNSGLADVRISLDAQRVIDLRIAAKGLMESEARTDDARQEAVGQAKQLLCAMKDLYVSMRELAVDVTASWERRSGGLASDEDHQRPEDLSRPSIADPTRPRDIDYRDTLLSVMLSFHAASQMILRECCIELIQFCAKIQGQEPNTEDLEHIQDERNAITRLSRAIFRCYSALWDYKDGSQADAANSSRSGRMIGRSYSLFTMTVIQRASSVSSEYRSRASDAIARIRANHELG